MFSWGVISSQAVFLFYSFQEPTNIEKFKNKPALFREKISGKNWLFD